MCLDRKAYMTAGKMLESEGRSPITDSKVDALLFEDTITRLEQTCYVEERVVRTHQGIDHRLIED